MKLIVVGGGLAGSIPAQVAHQLGIPVTVFDDNQKFGASRSSENLFSYTWSDTLGKDRVEIGTGLLKKYFKIDTIPFWTGKRVNPTLHLPVSRVLWPNPILDRVISIKPGEVRTEGGRIATGTVLVAAGWWCREFGLKMPPLDALTGHGFLVNGTLKQPPQMNFWAPYRHQKIFQWDSNVIWYGDSTTIVDKNYKEEKMVQTSLRRARHMGVPLQNGYRIVYGRRPFCPSNKKGFFDKIATDLYVSTSGWKCGLVIYAHQARLFLEDLGVKV